MDIRSSEKAVVNISTVCSNYLTELSFGSFTLSSNDLECPFELNRIFIKMLGHKNIYLTGCI